VASLKEGELQAEPTHFGKKQSGKTLNSTISTHNNYNDLVVQDQTNSQEEQENHLHNLIHQ